MRSPHWTGFYSGLGLVEAKKSDLEGKEGTRSPRGDTGIPMSNGCAKKLNVISISFEMTAMISAHSAPADPKLDAGPEKKERQCAGVFLKLPLKIINMMSCEISLSDNSPFWSQIYKFFMTSDDPVATDKTKVWWMKWEEENETSLVGHSRCHDRLKPACLGG